MSNARGEKLKALAIDYAEEAGLTVLGVSRTNGSHQRMALRLPGGRETAFIFPWSPSDARGHLNMRADLRRLARTGYIRGHGRAS